MIFCRIVFFKNSATTNDICYYVSFRKKTIHSAARTPYSTLRDSAGKSCLVQTFLAYCDALTRICHILQTRNSRRKVENSRDVFEAKPFVTSDRNCYFSLVLRLLGMVLILTLIGYNLSGRLFSIHVLVLR